MLKRYKVRYGSNVFVLDLPHTTTIYDIKRNDVFRANLGYGDNVNALYGGVTMPDEALAPEFIDHEGRSLSNPYYGAITMETACNKKQ